MKKVIRFIGVITSPLSVMINSLIFIVILFLISHEEIPLAKYGYGVYEKYDHYLLMIGIKLPKIIGAAICIYSYVLSILIFIGLILLVAEKYIILHKKLFPNSNDDINNFLE